jgi:hypothetical protein
MWKKTTLSKHFAIKLILIHLPYEFAKRTFFYLVFN